QEFRARFPLGSTHRVVLVDGNGRYAGIVALATAYADGAHLQEGVERYARLRETVLSADLGIVAAMRAFDATQADELVVVDGERRPIGVLSEGFARRRYAEELEKKQMEMLGERFAGEE
ncbi:MAG TPA: chloride channel protein, partial [Xanthomonadaceae bacterium]|nr:chloride channel protein [Xanthomonadaceae bacterium]